MIIRFNYFNFVSGDHVLSTVLTWRMALNSKTAINVAFKNKDNATVAEFESDPKNTSSWIVYFLPEAPW